MAELTPRQAEIARLLAAGKSTKAIARELHISPRTAEQHIADAARRLPPGHGSPRYRLLRFALLERFEGG